MARKCQQVCLETYENMTTATPHITIDATHVVHHVPSPFPFSVRAETYMPPAEQMEVWRYVVPRDLSWVCVRVLCVSVVRLPPTLGC